MRILKGADTVMTKDLMNERICHEVNLDKLFFKENYCFDVRYLSYYLQRKNSVDIIYMCDSSVMESFINDSNCVFAVDVNEKSTVVSYDRYCSQEHIDRLHTLYDGNTGGVCLVYQHKDCNEYMSIGVGSKVRELNQLMRSHDEMRKKVAFYFRNCISQCENKSVLLPTFRRNESSFKRQVFGEGFQVPAKRLYIYHRGNVVYLTKMELCCWQLTVQCLSYKEIAIRLGISTKTIESHMLSLRRKLCLKNKHELYLVALRNQLI